MRVISCAARGRSNGEWHSSKHYQMLELGSERFSNALSSVQKDYMAALVYEKD